MEHRKRNDQVIVRIRSGTWIGRRHLAVARHVNHVPIQIPYLGRGVGMPEEPRHYVVASLALVVVGALGVREPEGAGTLDALVGEEAARDAEVELGFLVPDLEVAGGVDVRDRGDGSGGPFLGLGRIRSGDHDREAAALGEVAPEAHERVGGQSHEPGGCGWRGHFLMMARSHQVAAQRKARSGFGSGGSSWWWALDFTVLAVPRRSEGDFT